jgi:alpha-1,2-mannosyltransferase
LCTAIAALQRTDPDVLSVVYSGDVDASKGQIIAKVKVNCNRYQSFNCLHLSKEYVCQARFDITLDPRSLHFVFLNTRHLVEDSTWPRVTLLGQSIGSMYLAWEAMSKLIPDLYIGQGIFSPFDLKAECSQKAHFLDTMGYAFTFHVVILLGRIPVGAYVHYPTISTDMLARVKSRTKWHTNTDEISSSTTLSHAKLL